MKKAIMSAAFAMIVASSFASSEPAPQPTPMENVGNAIVSGVSYVVTVFGQCLMGFPQ